MKALGGIKGDDKMKKALRLLLAFLVVVGLLLAPVISSAVPGNGNGDGNAGGNGNHYGWDKDNDNVDADSVPIPEPITLTLVGFGIAGVGSYFIVRKRQR